MTKSDLYDALAAADPARDARAGSDPAAREEMLVRVKASAPAPELPTKQLGHRRRAIVLIPAALLCAAAVTVSVGLLDSGEVREPFIERAYAAAAPPETVVHLRTRLTVGGPASNVQQERTDETWLRPGRQGFLNAGTIRDRDGTERRIVVAADRSRTKVWADAKVVQQFDGPPNPGRAGFFDPDAEFRKLYDAGRVQDAGSATVSGRSARIFRKRNGDALITYAVDATTLRPIRWTTVVRDVRTNAVRLTSTYEITLREETNSVPRVSRLLDR